MPRAISIHIGVNQPQKRSLSLPLQCCESTAWGMAAIAERAGYDSMLVLRGAEATRKAVEDALVRAAETLRAKDTLFVSFSGHGTQVRDAPFGATADREVEGKDEVWCLYDDLLKDDQLAGYWQPFKREVRILVVSESCFGGGMGRIGEKCPTPYESAAAEAQPSQPTGVRGAADAGAAAKPCPEPPKEAHGIEASVLLLAACREDQHARDGVFARHLFAVWNNGAFRGSYCELFWRVHDRVVAEAVGQQPRIQLLGAPDPGFPQATAFHRPVYR